MSDPNDRTASVLLKKQGKTDAIFLYDFAQFSGQNEDSGLFRIKRNGRWYSPDDKYTAFSAEAVAGMVCDWLVDAAPPAPRPEGLDRPQRVFAHWEGDDAAPCCDTGCGIVWTKTPPHMGPDGRWWIWIEGPRMVRCEDIRLLTREELRQAAGRQKAAGAQQSWLPLTRPV